MPVTFIVTPHPAEAVEFHPQRLTTSVNDLFTMSCEDPAKHLKTMIKSSVQTEDLKHVIPTKNGFVSTCIEAYNKHHHLTLRPDDVWIAILSQLNLYVNAHAEELRKSFVTHKGQVDLKILFPIDTRHTVNPSDMAHGFAELLRKNVVDDKLYDFIMPDFTTTGPVDETACCIMMMSTLKRYFRYVGIGGCGLPSVTLLGEKSDYESIERRLSKLAAFGKEPRRWADLLRPILKRFVQAFDGEVDTNFWQCIFTRSGNMSVSEVFYSGWITAFCPFNNQGKWQLSEIKRRPPREIFRSYKERKELWDRLGMTVKNAYPPPLFLDGVAYGHMPTNISVVTHCQVDVKWIEGSEGGKEYPLSFVAGLVGATVSSVEGGKNNALTPYTAWFMYEKSEQWENWKDWNSDPDRQDRFLISGKTNTRERKAALDKA